MTRLFSIIAAVAITAIGWVLFELQNVGPVNADRTVVLRLLFSGFATASIASFIFSRSHFLPALCIAAAFAATSAFSRSIISLAYAASAMAIIALMAVLCRLAKQQSP